ncbi:MAG: prepilin peptidase [Candidatus Wildermuthbacteria bacterium]|nr:prepilin peptidase [Candidatus Wildermuthbacteria bacterium]
MALFFVFLFGLAVGSFLNAFIYRLEVQEGLRQVSHDRRKADVTVLRGRSFCPHCGHTLAWHDLIPLLSFLFLRGKCRYCKRPISWQYPLVEFATGLVFFLIFNFQFSIFNEFSISQFLNLLYLLAMAALLIAIFVYDLKHFLIPDKVLYPAIGLAFSWRVFEFLNLGFAQSFDWAPGRMTGWISLSLVQALLAGISAAAFFLAIFLISRGAAMGFGDVKFAFLLGLFLGWPSILVALFSAFCLGAVSGTALIALKKKGLKSEVPFAPFLIMGTAIAYFFGSSLIHWYLGLFLV